MVKDCFFCKIANGEISSEKKIYENDNFFSISDANQQVEGHSLVISKKHFETVLDLPSTLGAELLDCIKKTTLKLIEKHKSEGFNIVSNNFECAGQIVKHVHFHILPRQKEGKVPRVF
jgi:histidine triad (HIT) family protein